MADMKGVQVADIALNGSLLPGCEAELAAHVVRGPS